MNVVFTSALTIVTATMCGAVSSAPKILPSGESVPENLLRIELVLDRPLGGVLDISRVSLTDDRGNPIAGAFYDIPLTSPDGKRIAILMHPGRVKTDVGPNRQAGLALRNGQRITMTIADPQLPRPIRKSWNISPAIRARIDTQAWRLLLPKPGGREPLEIQFPAALNANAKDLIAVSASDGRRLEGRVTLSQGERHWRFRPETAWKSGHFEVRVHASLEDPQGNRMCAAFEQAGQSAIACDEDARIPFEVINETARRGLRKLREL